LKAKKKKFSGAEKTTTTVADEKTDKIKRRKIKAKTS